MPIPREHQDVLDNVRAATIPGYAPGANVLDSLIEANWVEPRDLVEAYDHLENGEPNRAVLLVRLPIGLRIPSEWIDLPNEYGNPRLFARRTGTRLNRLDSQEPFAVRSRTRIVDEETFVNATLPVDPYGLLIRTQLLVSFKLWEHRRVFFQRYLRCTETPETLKEVIVPPARSWLKSRRAITAEMYEHDLLERLFLETQHLLPRFLTAYAISSLDPSGLAPPVLDCCVLMVSGGRLVVRGPGISPLARAAQAVAPGRYEQNLRELKKTLAANRKAASVYEKYLLDAVRHVESGAPNLGIVYAVMILEWFVNEMVADRIMRPLAERLSGDRLSDFAMARLRDRHVRLPDKLRQYLPMAGLALSKPVEVRLVAAIEARNRIVHTAQATAIEPQVALGMISSVITAVQSLMDQVMATKNSTLRGR